MLSVANFGVKSEAPLLTYHILSCSFGSIFFIIVYMIVYFVCFCLIL